MTAQFISRVARYAVGLYLLLAAHIVLAGNPSLTFKEGWVGEYSSNIAGPQNMYAFDGGTPDLNIRQVTIAQNSSTNAFEFQGGGNDIPVSITVEFTDGTRQTVDGAVSWRETASNKLRGIGLRIDQTLNDGYTLSSGYKKTYLLKIPGSTLSIANGAKVSGNAAGVLD